MRSLCPQKREEARFQRREPHLNNLNKPDHPPMPLLNFGGWRPDISDYAASATQNILNELPRGAGCGPLPG
jgi:hypothetical protein